MPLPTDPQLAVQWHLINTTPGGLDLNVSSVWNPSNGPAYTGSDVSIAQTGIAFQYSHPDLAVNYSTTLDYDFLNNDVDPAAVGGGLAGADGTALLGLIAANDNGLHGVGVAFDALVFGYGVLSLPTPGQMATWFDHMDQVLTSATQNADVLSLNNALGDVASMQFTAQVSATQLDGLRADVGAAVATGRAGLGLIITVGSGFMGALAQNSDTNSYGQTTDTRQIIVGSIQQSGYVSGNSSEGTSILVSAFGSGLGTVDNTGADGFVAGDFNAGYFGTGAAAALVSGVVSLVLDANDLLGWRDVQTILAYGARHVGTDVGQGFNSSAGFNEGSAWFFNGATNWNTGGLHYSNVYGYGLVDAHASVRMAETWFLGLGTVAAQTSANETALTADLLSTETTLNGSSATLTTTVTEDLVVERVAVSLDFQTAFLGDVDVLLIGPDGTEITLLADQASGADFDGTWVVEGQALRGISSAGLWQVIIRDDATVDPTVFRDVQLTIYGSAQVNDRYIFTNEYSDYGAYNRINTVVDTDGGTDVANAAAVTGNSRIFLDGRVSLIDNMRTTFSGVENAIGGDGNDTISGSSGSNMIWGGRGRDSIQGLEGRDTLHGDSGNDQLRGEDGNDRLFGGDGNDTLYGGFIGSGSITTDDDTLDGGTGSDFIYAGEGNDIILMGVGNDYVDGGTGFNAASYADEAGGILVDLSGTLTHIGGALGDFLVNIARLTGGDFDDTLLGNAQDNWLTGGAGFDELSGGDGLDSLFGGDGTDAIYGGNGNDTLSGGSGADLLDGGNGSRDKVYYSDSTIGLTVDLATPGANTGIAAGDTYFGVEDLVGSGHADQLYGSNGTNILYGGNGDDVLDGRGSIDHLYGGAGNDTTIGGSGNDMHVLDSSGDRVFETTTTTSTIDAGGIDRVQASISVNLDAYAGIRFVENLILTGSANLSGTGNALANTLTGNTGNNLLNGGLGNDVLIGGAGADNFVFNTALGATNIDSLTDYDVAADTIRLENAIFIGLSTGTLAASAFVANTSGNAADTSDRIIYETDTGRLFFDRDGTGAVAKIHFATLATGLAVTNADFLVI